MKEYLRLPIEGELALVHAEVRMAQEMFELIDSDRAHLRPYLEFVDEVKDKSSQEAYIKMKLVNEAKGTDALFMIALGEELIGCIDLHFIDQVNDKADIGYWLHSAYINQGIISKAVRKICDYAFDGLGLNRLSIVADVNNVASNQVAQKQGFTWAGTQKQEQKRYGAYHDMNHYYLLKKEFKNA